MSTSRSWLPIALPLLIWTWVTAAPTLALDPPHDFSQSIDCGNCHITHHAPGGAITTVAGNPNLCMSCHTVGGLAPGKPFADTDEAIPGISGTSHRWDSGPSGWVKPAPGNTSLGTVQSNGAFTGSYAKTYTLTIEAAGEVGTATFGWTTSKPLAETYRDELTNVAFDGTNGTTDWSTNPWQEAGEADGPAAGVLRVATDGACAAGNCLRIGGGTIDARALSRAADTGEATSGMLTFSYQRRLTTCPSSGTANVRLQVTSDGTTWTTLATYHLNACETVPVAQAFDISAHLGAAMQIRFLGAGTTGTNDFLYVDDVQVEELVADAVTNGVTTAGNVLLDEGIQVTFADGPSSPSFQLNDRWTVYVRPDVDQPSMLAVAARVTDGKINCSACHNQHNQIAQPFDPAAPPYPLAGPGGEGRHNQRVDNDTNQMCTDCHGTRNVGSAAQGSHPVGVAIPAGAYKVPDVLPLNQATGSMECMTCHTIHGSPIDDGSLARVADVTSLCSDCHTLADTATPASHLDSSTGALWPGPQYGTLFPAITDSGKRGACTNCHQPHGWPDEGTPGADYPALLVSREESLCYACHDGSPAAENVLLQFTKSYRHPTSDFSGRHDPAEGGNAASYGATNRHAECEDCHNPHVAGADTVEPVAPAASNRLAGVGRVAVTNGAAGTVPAYEFRGPSDVTPVAEYELCFKCHSSWTTQPAGQPDMAMKFNPNNPSYHPVEALGKNTNIRINSFVNGWTPTQMMYCTDCHTSEDVTVRGPHGSQYPFLLERPFVASSARRTTASTEACFACHSFNTYANKDTNDTVQAYSRFNRPNFEEGHSYHVVEKRAPCYACHDSHGSGNLPHLMITGRNPGLNSYTETSTGGRCSPTCHGSENYTLNYPR